MIGYIYKITCTVSNKIYIGQSKQDINVRFKRHLYDAIDRPRPLQTKFARAIRKYGRDAFYIELVETVDGSVKDITEREYYYINLYDAVKTGYNSTDARCRSGGNTYFGKSEQEMQIIKDKIAETKFGARNPHSARVKCKDVVTEEILHFDTMKDAQEYLGLKEHHTISARCLRQTKKLLLDRYICAYEDEEFISDYHIGNKFGINKYKSITVKDLETGEIKSFESYTAAEKNYNWYRGAVQAHLPKGQYKHYKLTAN